MLVFSGSVLPPSPCPSWLGSVPLGPSRAVLRHVQITARIRGPSCPVSRQDSPFLRGPLSRLLGGKDGVSIRVGAFCAPSGLGLVLWAERWGKPRKAVQGSPLRAPPSPACRGHSSCISPGSCSSRGGWALAHSAPWGWVQNITFLAPFKGFVTTKPGGETFVKLKVSVGSWRHAGHLGSALRWGRTP